jgi:opacity protein-like surface antigen
VKSVEGVAAIASAAALACWCSAAQAYRPFDGTDAAVAETGEVEIELGPVGYLRDGADRTLSAPNLRINYGFTPGWEATLEGILAHGLTADIPGTRLVENEALLKTVLREGSLQEKSGPSIATEFGVLLPGINDEHGTGAVLNGIISQRWDWGTAHLNAQIELTREQHADYFLDTIIEGPHDWVVRPVAEIFYERDVDQFRTRSALIGAIWQVQDNIAVDFGLRGAHVNDHTVGEIRAGVTFAFGVTKGPDILSRLIATTLHGVH